MSDHLRTLRPSPAGSSPSVWPGWQRRLQLTQSPGSWSWRGHRLLGKAEGLEGEGVPARELEADLRRGLAFEGEAL